MSSTGKSLLFWLVIFAVVVVLWQTIQPADERGLEELTFSDFVEALEEERLEEVTIAGDELTGRFKAGQYEGARNFFTRLPDYPDLISKLLEADVQITAEPAGDNSAKVIFLTWGPVLLIVGIWIYFMRSSRR